jgi:cation diffusion facilitator family transporter
MVEKNTCGKTGVDRGFLTRFACLSIAAAIATIVLKTTAYLMTDSVGLLSDAFESIVNLIGAVMTFAMLKIASRPPDKEHLHGHSKAEYFSSSIEGLLILFAAAGIAYAAVTRLIEPKPLEKLGLGLLISMAASIINLIVALILMRAGKRHNSIALEADGHHLMTDVWTSVGVIAGIAVVSFTGWNRLDPIVALIVALNIVWTGVSLLRRSVSGLMDAALPEEDQKIIEAIISTFKERGVDFHALRTRQAGSRRFVSVHILIPGRISLHDAHHLAEDFEKEVRQALCEASVTTHLEPIDDEISMEDIDLDR